MDTITRLLIGVALVAIAFIAGWFVVEYARSQENEARYQCAMSVRYEVSENGTTISYPPEDLYKECLKEKGL